MVGSRWAVGKLPEGERAELLVMAQQYQDAVERERGQNDFMGFVKDRKSVV